MSTDTHETTRPRTRRPSRGPSGRGPRVLQYVIAFIAAVVVVNAIVGERGLLTTLKTKRQYEQLLARTEALQQENAELRRRIQRLRDDPAAIEEVARRNLGLMKPGELIFIIKDVPPSGRTTPRP